MIYGNKLLWKSLGGTLPTITTHASLTTSLVGYWKLDETSGTTAYGEISGYNGTSLDTTSTSGKISTSYQFNGSTAKVALPVFGSITVFTWSAWVYIPTGYSAPGIILAKATETSPNYVGMLVNTDRTFAQGGRNPANAYWVRTSTAVLPYNTWTHLVYVSNNNGQYGNIYINGVNQTSFTSEGITYNSTSTCNTHTIGKNIWDGRETYRFPFSGKIDEVAEWDRVLTAAEIADLYNAGAGLPYN